MGPRQLLLALWSPLGGFRSSLVWRLFGACLLVNALLNALQPVVQDASDWPQYGFAFSGLLLVLFGARLALLAVSGAWGLACFGLVLSDTSQIFFFPAAEWTIWLVLPIATALVCLVALADDARNARRAASEVLAALDPSVLAVLRILVVIALASAALHKVNSDFLFSDASCISLKRRLVEWWALPAIFASPTPLTIVALELLVPILLLAVPLLGILLAIAVTGAFISIGAPAFGLLVVTMAVAFLPKRAEPAVKLFLRRRGAWVLVASAACVGALGSHFRGDFPWPPIALAQLIALTCFCVVGAALLDAVRTGVLGRERIERQPAPVHATLWFLTMLLSFNALTPYLGLKFQYSFAMLSNLRVDDERWNSLIFPRALRLTAHDPFVHVERVRYTKLTTGETFDDGGILPPGLYAPEMVRYRLYRALERGVRVALDFTYEGISYHFIDVTDEAAAMYALFDRIPSTPWFQKVLDQAGPQTCAH